ncbi:Coenzyme F420 hydrogenase/dehydrogenase, beta subunit C-terminal domain [Acetobacterium wieringae]|uniref:Coenzyme F420 hydrogenase/dehydrogenase, beta subunit C-terminal domain n=1 Tax=Acetobacterium wieringae TaxID=52694 RepID=UPI0023ECC16D|nr:Coenzyme F420 hydrogenase/dehydrogenase, beta subunit C-terminal domain [Acetobacterium wieringae]
MEKNKCTGCGVCENVCPKGNISMESDSEGFLYPEIDVINCISCEMCVTHCPVINPLESTEKLKELKAYAAWSRNKEIRYNSTSGGIFSELAHMIILQGGYVAGAIYDENLLVHHHISNCKDDIIKLRQSKYVQSKTGKIYARIKKILDDGKLAMFVGSPCQVSGLNRFLDKEYKNLLTCDFICRGANSPKAYLKYLLSLENKFGSKVERVWFKNKKNGWNKFCTKIEFENGQEYYADRYTDPYMKGYLKYNLFIRPSCSQCQFKGLPRYSDITLADYWGVNLRDENVDIEQGISLIIINTKNGKANYDLLIKRIFRKESDLTDALKNNQCANVSIKHGIYRDKFFEEIDETDFMELIKNISKEREK